MAEMEDREQNSLYVVYRESDDKVKITKVGKGEHDEVVVEAVHHVTGGKMCDCPGFGFRGECKHLKMADSEVCGKAMTLHEARVEVAKLINDFREDFDYVGLPAEAYEKDEHGLVTCATLIFRKAKKASEIFREGTWEGCLKGSLLKVRMIVE